MLVYVCASAALCPGGTVQGFTNSHSIPAGRYGLTPAEIASLDPLAIGPSRAVSDHFKKYPLPNDPGRDGINYMGFRFAAPIENQFKTYINPSGLPRGRWREPPDVLPRCHAGRRDQSARRSSPVRRRARVATNGNFGYAIGYDAVVSQNLVNTFRYGLSKIEEATLGLQEATP